MDGTHIKMGKAKTVKVKFKTKGNAKKIPDTENKNLQEVSSMESVKVTNIKEPIDKKAQATAPTPEADDSKKIEDATKEFLSPKMMLSFTDSVFISIAKIGGDHWRLEPFESENLSKALTNYLNVVLPEVFKKQPELFALCLTAGVVMLPRVVESVKRNKSKKNKGIDNKSSESTPGKPATTQESNDTAGNRGDSKESKAGPGTMQKVA